MSASAASRAGPAAAGSARETEDDSEDAPIAFVAVDLVALDGEPLVEIPLLERKRLLESVLAEGDLVRRTPYVRHPAGTFIVTWRSFGFGGLAYKAANSRYVPGRDQRRLVHDADAAPLRPQRGPTGAAARGRRRAATPKSTAAAARRHRISPRPRARASWYGTGVPVSLLSPALAAEIQRLGHADIMVGIPSFKNAATIGHVVRAAQAGLVQYFPDLRPLLVNADAGSSDGTQRVVAETEPPDYVERILLVRPTNRLERLDPDLSGGRTAIGGKGAALRTIFEIAAALEVRALVVVDSDLRSIGPEWVELLSGPILKGGFDFVAPLYARHKYDGTITNTVTYPLTRALYGRRIRQPIGGDFGVSGDLVRHYLAQDDWTPEVSRFGIDIWMTTHALTGGFAVCEARLGAKIHDPKDPSADLGPMFRQVVGTILAMAGRHPEAVARRPRQPRDSRLRLRATASSRSRSTSTRCACSRSSTPGA